MRCGWGCPFGDLQAGTEIAVRCRAARRGAAPPRPAPRCHRDPAADHFQGGPGSRFENAGAADGAPVRAGAAAAAARRGHGRERHRHRERRRQRQRRRGLGRAAAARLAPALLQPAAEAAHDGDRGGAAGTWGQPQAGTGSRGTEGAGGTWGSRGHKGWEGHRNHGDTKGRGHERRAKSRRHGG